MRTLVAIAVFLTLLTITGCRPRDRAADPPQVVLYCSADDHIAKPVIEAFQRQTGITVLYRGDTEATKNTGLVERIRAERTGPTGDVFWSSEVFLTLRLADEGLLAPHDSPAVADWPAALRDPDRRWHGFAQRARVLVYNTDRLKPGQVPQTMHELLEPRFKGRVVMARPQFGTTRGHMAALLALWGEEPTRYWLRSLRDNGVRLLDGNAAVVRAVASGEADVGLTDTDDVWAGQRNDWPVDLGFIRHDLPGISPTVSAGPLLIPNSVSLIKGGPNPAHAANLVDFLLSEQVERLLAESESRNIPVRPALAAQFPHLAVEHPAEISLSDVAAAMNAAMELVAQELTP